MNLDKYWDWEEIVDSINTDVIVADSKGNIVYSNSSVEIWLNIKKTISLAFPLCNWKKRECSTHRL
ncbi:hypothetical protein [Oceanobacillus sp. AG]|uniref:hypothetical protein n=1 Tax=Oceanobacillus sp. AG TaxID=2681969 RepID=UPI0018DC8FA2|nr:hypothetical protein [Oceanobacillus sp. AG]